MYYKKVTDGTLEIEFANDWLGYERVYVNGQLVSTKYSVYGIEHQFSAIENGKTHYYSLKTKVNAQMAVFIDIAKNGELIHEDLLVPVSGKPKAPKNNYKSRGIALVSDFDLEDGIKELKEALNYSPTDPDIYFHLACAYSVMEQPDEGFSCLAKAIRNNMQNQDIINTHEMLSFIRMHKAYAGFVESKFLKFEI